MTALWAAAGLLALVIGGVRRGLMVVTVRGTSMLPTFHEGDRLLVRRNGRKAVQRDAVIVLAYDGTARELMVKRVAAGPGDAVPPGMPVSDGLVPSDRLLVVGDNAAGSGDSRRTGYYATSAVVGAVLRRL